MTKWKRSIKGMDFGTIDIRIRDHNGTVIWDFKRRGKNNIPDGIWGFSQFLKEKMGYELVSLLMVNSFLLSCSIASLSAVPARTTGT
jgi:hypothetical protein